MAVFNAAKEGYLLSQHDDKPILFTNIRPSRGTAPRGLFYYDIKHSTHLDAAWSKQ